MKKVLLTLAVLCISTSNLAFATYEVQYMNTGAPKNFTQVAFGSNAPWLPGNRELHAQRVRQVRRYNAETEAIRNRNNINLNINTNGNRGNNILTKESSVSLKNEATTSKKVETKKFTSSTCNGITYYMQNNPCTL